MLSLYPTNPTVIGEIGNAATGFNLMIDCYNFVLISEIIKKKLTLIKISTVNDIYVFCLK